MNKPVLKYLNAFGDKNLPGEMAHSIPSDALTWYAGVCVCSLICTVDVFCVCGLGGSMTLPA